MNAPFWRPLPSCDSTKLSIRLTEASNDVFFAARNRKQEIKEQIKELEKGLKRQTIKPRSNKKHR